MGITVYNKTEFILLQSGGIVQFPDDCKRASGHPSHLRPSCNGSMPFFTVFIITDAYATNSHPPPATYTTPPLTQKKQWSGMFARLN